MRLKLLVCILVLPALAGCQSGSGRSLPTLPPLVQLPAGTASAVEAQLSVVADPPGAQVTVDGHAAGVSPLDLMLPAGEHQVSVSAAGYAPETDTLDLEAGKQGIYSPTLDDVAPPVIRITADPQQLPLSGRSKIHASAIDNRGVVEIQILANGQLLADDQAAQLDVEVAPAVLAPGPGGVYSVAGRAVDAAGNAGEAILVLTALGAAGPTPAPTRPTAAPAGAATVPSSAQTARPTAPPTTVATAPSTAVRATPPAAAVVATPAAPEVTSYSAGSIIIPTYPYTRFLHTVTDPNTLDYPVFVLDRAAYEAARPQPVPVAYTLVTLENRYVRLTILPDLGGRIYECVFKPTGNDELYRNPVIKPSAWGPPAPPYPAGANWWLAAGGLEWAFPVEEHGYEWAKPWGYDFYEDDDGSATVTVFMQDYRRPYVAVAITLPPDSAAFTVNPRIVNPLGAPFRFKWWDNATLAPGAPNKPGADLHFIIPGKEVTVHSAGDGSVPAAGQAMSWPVYNGRDLSRLGNWQSWLGFFARPAAQAGFAGVYDTGLNEGMLRIFPPDVVRGVKGFAGGWAKPNDPGNWTDDGSGYVELHGGLAPTFDDWNELPPGGQVEWTETWYPAAGIGGVVSASAGGAINVSAAPGGVTVSVFPSRALRGSLNMSLPGAGSVVRQVQIDPSRPYVETISGAGPGDASVTLTGADGQVVVSYKGPVR